MNGKVRCEIVAVGKRRDGGTRYWCLAHRADATAKYGRRAKQCRYADQPVITEKERLRLRVPDYPGGIALWGAVPPVYDTTLRELDRGIHVHARLEAKAEKVHDRTYREVVLGGIATDLAEPDTSVSELDAIYYMVSRVFEFETALVRCGHCGLPHLDKDWFSVHPHQRHLCAGCGQHFRDARRGIGNPIAGVQELVRYKPQPPEPATEPLEIRQVDFQGGIQIWGSNEAILWTAPTVERAGIHVHAFESVEGTPARDETFGVVRIDGVELDQEMVRILMAQRTLPHLDGRIVSCDCSRCGRAHFDRGVWAYTPHEKHRCVGCGTVFRAKHRLRKTIANPLIKILEHLGTSAPRRPQAHRLGLITEEP